MVFGDAVSHRDAVAVEPEVITAWAILNLAGIVWLLWMEAAEVWT